MARSKRKRSNSKSPNGSKIRPSKSSPSFQQQQQSSPSDPYETTKLKHFVVPPYSERATFELKHHQNTNKPALLTIQSVKESDAGLYWCRVDYRWTRTTISKVRLNVMGMFLIKIKTFLLL